MTLWVDIVSRTAPEPPGSADIEDRRAEVPLVRPAFRPEGPALNSHGREAVVGERNSMSAEGAALRLKRALQCRALGSRPDGRDLEFIHLNRRPGGPAMNRPGREAGIIWIV